MPSKPINDIKGTGNLNATSADVLNVIRDGASSDYQCAVPFAQNTVESIKEIGRAILPCDSLRNEFVASLVNRIGRVIVTSKLYNNPWGMFRKGVLELGETVEEIFVNIARPHQFDQIVAEKEVFRREIPDIQAAFHSINYEKYYKQTVSYDMLRKAFVSLDGLNDLISRITEAMYSAANYDEFVVMKYMLAKEMLGGNVFPEQIPEFTNASDKDTLENIIGAVKGGSNLLTFMSPSYNRAHVRSYSDKQDQYLITTAKFDGMSSVKVLAAAFNMSEAEFMGHRIMIDSFAQHDIERLNDLFGDADWYTPFSPADIQKLESVGAVIVDRDWWMIFDNVYDFDSLKNPEGMYWNYWYHTWKIYSVSPFANAVMFTSEPTTITSVTVTPIADAVKKGKSVQLTAVVDGTGFAANSVTWGIAGATSHYTQINSSGLLTIGRDETATTITVTATSTINTTKSGTATVTIS